MGNENGTPGKAAAAGEPSASHDRRAALRRLGGYVMSVAPAMVILTGSTHAGNGNGNGSGSGIRPEPPVPCENPAWDLGLKRAGHSGY